MDDGLAGLYRDVFLTEHCLGERGGAGGSFSACGLQFALKGSIEDGGEHGS